MTSDQSYPFGYCTNVHAGVDFAAAKHNLEEIACRVRDLTTAGRSLPVGLWLAEPAARVLSEGDHAARFRDWLSERGLKPYTFNGFPQGDFHQEIVKHAVYEPDWRSESRLNYTLKLIDILAALLPEGGCGSISTLPLGWPHQDWQTKDYRAAADHLLRAAAHLKQTALQTGVEIVLAVEPEPGCVLDTADDLEHFFTRYLFRSDNRIADEETARRHLTVCHDICHSAVMFEPQETALSRYASAGIRLGKVQVSAAVSAAWSSDPADDLPNQDESLAQLSRFNEPRYLHQTTRCMKATDDLNQEQATEIVDDLSIALASWKNEPQRMTRDQWRVHFHVPIFVDRFGALRATQSDIRIAVAPINSLMNEQAAGRPWFTGHYEVETYAWGVLPEHLKTATLAEGIAQELQFFESVVG
ncbi:MAG: metabolite traffic protein EboE [Pirellulales bacterium]